MWDQLIYAPLSFKQTEDDLATIDPQNICDASTNVSAKISGQNVIESNVTNCVDEIRSPVNYEGRLFVNYEGCFDDMPTVWLQRATITKKSTVDICAVV